MKYLCMLLAGVAAALLLAGCGGDGSPEADFTSFVKALVENTADDTEPEDINRLKFRFTEDEAAFDDLFL